MSSETLLKNKVEISEISTPKTQISLLSEKHPIQNNHEACNKLAENIPNRYIENLPETNSEKQESLSTKLQANINRYPFRQYINLEKGFNVHFRPNYYESDQEDQEETVKKRRQSLSESVDVEELSLNKKLQQRRHSEDSTVFGSDTGDAEDEVCDELTDDNVCVTRTVTYTSKKQILEFSQKEFVNLSQIMINPDKACEMRQMETENLNGTQVKLKIRGENEDPSYTQKEMESFYNDLNQKQDKIAPNTQVQTNFLEKLGLKGPQQEKSGKILKNHDKYFKSTKIKEISHKSVMKGKESKINPNSKSCYDKLYSGTSIKKVSVTHIKKTNGVTNHISSGKDKTSAKSHQSKPHEEHPKIVKPIKPSNEQEKEKVDLSNKQTPTFYEILQKARTNLHNPNSSKPKNSTKSDESKLHKCKKTNIPQRNETSKMQIPTKNNADKNKQLPAEKTNSSFRKENQPSSSSEKSKKETSSGKRKLYNMDDVERKLRSIFGEPETENVKKKIRQDTGEVKSAHKSDQGAKTCHAGGGKGKEKDSKFCILHKEKSREKKPRDELQKTKHDKVLHKKEKVQVSETCHYKNKDLNNEIQSTGKKMDALKAKLNTLCKIKSALEQTFCLKETCSKESSKSTKVSDKAVKYKPKTKEKDDSEKNQKEQKPAAKEKHKNCESVEKSKTKITPHKPVTNKIRVNVSAGTVENIETNNNNENVKNVTDTNILCSEILPVTENVSLESNSEKKNEATETANDITLEVELQESSQNEVIDVESQASEQNPSVITQIESNDDMAEESVVHIDCSVNDTSKDVDLELNSTEENENSVQHEISAESIELDSAVAIIDEIPVNPEVISLLEDVTDETNSEEMEPECCCCCRSPKSTDTKPKQYKLMWNFEQNIVIDITGDNEQEKSDITVKEKLELYSEIIVLDDDEEELESSIEQTHNLTNYENDISDLSSSALETSDVSLTNSVAMETSTRESVVLSKLSNILATSGVPMWMHRQSGKSVTTDNGESSSSASITCENMFPDDSEEDQDLRDFISKLTQSIETHSLPDECQEAEDPTSTPNSSHTVTNTEHVISYTTNMEHYKKRLIHQHEKPGPEPSPYTTTEEEDDPESPLSPASSVQSRDSGSRDKRKDETGRKVARKRAVCRSQFRHQNMEIFKLGSSIPTSLCKTREPYNVCAEKNLQRCFQNGAPKKDDNSPSPSSSKGSLTESIISTMDGSKKKDVHVWRSVSLNSADSNNTLHNGRHILPAIVPELPDRRKNRVKSLPEASGGEKNRSPDKPPQPNSSEFMEENKEVVKKREDIEESNEETQNDKPSTSDSDVPMNLSLKTKENSPDRPKSTVCKSSKPNEPNNNQYLSSVIPRQPSNVPRRPQRPLEVETVSDGSETLQTLEDSLFYLTDSPASVVDVQKQNGIVVVSFPELQQQMLRMSNMILAQQSPMNVFIDATVKSLSEMVKSTVETGFQITSLPILNRLYVDLMRYAAMPVSAELRARIDATINTMVSYLLGNLFRVPHTAKYREFVSKLLQLDLRPHVDFLINLQEVIRNRIHQESFMDSVLQILAMNPQDDLERYQRAVRDILQTFSAGNRDVSHRNQLNVPVAIPVDPMAVIPHLQPPRRPQARQAESNPTARSQNLEGVGVAPTRPDLYLTDNRCIPPNAGHVYPEMARANLPKTPKGRQKTANKVNKSPTKSVKGSASMFVPEMPDERAIYRERQFFELTSAGLRQTMTLHNETGLMRNGVPFMNRSRSVPQNGGVTPYGTMEGARNAAGASTSGQIPRVDQGNHRIPKDLKGKTPVNRKPENYFPNRGRESMRNENAPHGNPLRERAVNKNPVIVKNDVPKHKPVEENRNISTVPNTVPEKVTKKPPATTSDVEQFLQTNIIVNKNQKVVTSDKTCDSSSVSVGKPTEDKYPTSDGTSGRETVQNGVSVGDTVQDGEIKEVMSGTVIIEDNSMEISKREVPNSVKEEEKPVLRNMDVDDVVLERVGPCVDVKHVPFSPSDVRSDKSEDTNKGSVGGTIVHERTLLESDMSIEKITEEPDTTPKLIRLATLKRKIIQKSLRQKKVRWTEHHNGDIVVIDDDEKDRLDYNQMKTNYSDTKENIETITENKPQESIPKKMEIKQPLIEDISSDEENVESFRLYSTYDSKAIENPKKILEETEVSHCPLIPGSIKVIESSNPQMFEKPPVYTRPVTPRNLTNRVDSWPPKESLAKMVRIENHEDEGKITCSLKVRNNSELQYPRSMDVSRYSPVVPSYYRDMENLTPEQMGLVPPGVVQRAQSVVQTSPSHPRSLAVQMPPALARRPVVQTSPVVPMSPTLVRSPVIRTSPALIRSPVVQTSPALLRSPVVQMSPKLTRARMSPSVMESNASNWSQWFADEQKKGVFNFERSENGTPCKLRAVERQNSVGSDCGMKYSPDDLYCEIKIDSKIYKIKRSIYDKIPKGKLCYIRESNTFVRYFDDNQMELFLSNLNVEGNGVADDLLKQVKGKTEGVPSGVDTFVGLHEDSKKGEVIVLSKDVSFSSEDFLSDPELYVEEVEKVQRFVPRDFYGFYKFVTGYQIINHHPPISFHTFLAMHNTNGIRGLFKNYINTLVEGRNVL